MTIAQEKDSWTGLGASVRGANHFRSGQPNQDAIFWTLPDKGPCQIIMALADGHGGSKSFRSGTGASFAVRLATAIVRDFLSAMTESATRNDVEDILRERTARKMETTWKQAVSRHVNKHPFEAEINATLGSDPFRAYGSTLIVVAITDKFAVFLQLGDGDTLIVSPDETTSRPFPDDPRFFANETASLCLPNAWRDFRVAVRDLETHPVDLILAATDGYSNSFRENTGFLRTGPDFLSLFRTEGKEFINERLETWLTETTQKGSGDDITLALLYPHHKPDAEGAL